MNAPRATSAPWARGSWPSRARWLVVATAGWLLLAAACVVIAVLPFKVVSRLLGQGRDAGVHAAEPETPPTARDLHRAGVAARAVAAAVRRSPWRSDCYPQALAARALLCVARVPHVVHFGLRRDDTGTLLAHAWVTTGGLVVVGGDPSRFTDVALYRWAPGSRAA